MKAPKAHRIVGMDERCARVDNDYYLKSEADRYIAHLKRKRCDHIRTRAQGDTPFFPNMLNNANVEVCLKEDVDEAIDELKAENESLKQKLHDAEMRADLAEAAETERKIDYDNLKKEHRQTLRELWLARAERAKDKQAYYTHIRGDGWVHLVDKWINVERLCLAKADTFKEAK